MRDAQNNHKEYFRGQSKVRDFFKEIKEKVNNEDCTMHHVKNSDVAVSVGVGEHN